MLASLVGEGRGGRKEGGGNVERQPTDRGEGGGEGKHLFYDKHGGKCGEALLLVAPAPFSPRPLPAHQAKTGLTHPPPRPLAVKSLLLSKFLPSLPTRPSSSWIDGRGGVIKTVSTGMTEWEGGKRKEKTPGSRGRTHDSP